MDERSDADKFYKVIVYCGVKVVSYITKVVHTHTWSVVTVGKKSGNVPSGGTMSKSTSFMYSFSFSLGVLFKLLLF